MASRTRHSVTMKTVLVQKIMHGDQEKKDHCNMYTGILFFLCHICSTQKHRWKSWDFLYGSFCIHTRYTTQPLSIRAATQRTVYLNRVLLGYISQAQFRRIYNEPSKPPPTGVQIPLSSFWWTTILTTLPQLHVITLHKNECILLTM